MGFLESIRTCLGKYAKFDGRASRSEYWFFVLFSSIYTFVGGLLLGMIGAADLESGIAIWVLMIPIIVPLTSAAARRLHDINQSGWMQCIFIPGFIADEFLGTGYVIYFLTLALFAFWFSQAGKKGKNRFGAQPRK